MSNFTFNYDILFMILIIARQYLAIGDTSLERPTLHAESYESGPLKCV